MLVLVKLIKVIKSSPQRLDIGTLPPLFFLYGGISVVTKQNTGKHNNIGFGAGTAYF